MVKVIFIAAALCTSAIGCVPVMEGKQELVFTYDAPPISQRPLSFNDTLCCIDCTV